MRALATLPKKRKLVIGLMSGTSVDAIDAALVEISGRGIHSKLRLVEYHEYPYPRGYRQFVLKNSDPLTARLDDIARLNILAARLFSDAAAKLSRKAKRRLSEVDLIGSHGQTIQHLPESRRLFGNRIRATLQVGHPAAIAKMTGVITVGDFRIGDVALGGTGAPLVPICDYLMMRSGTKNRIALNIGGISNMTSLPCACRLKDVRAFDTGPGNMVIDALARRFFGRDYDKGGTIAASGRINSRLLRWMMAHPYLRKKPPKSTGREIFGEAFVREILRRTGRGARHEDIIATVTDYTALAIFDQYLRFIRPAAPVDEVLVSGGGAHNMSIMRTLQSCFSPARVRTTDDLRIPGNAKEAICFALLATEALAGNSTNIPAVTGARRETVLGTICLP